MAAAAPKPRAAAGKPRVKRPKRTSGRTRTAELILEELAQKADELTELEEDAERVRGERNGLILEARRIKPKPPTLVKVAQIARVGNSYVSRVERDKGKPRSGHETGNH